jgi:UDP-glucose 4-epimerase
MKILVTGGAGFIGSHLVKSLDEQGHEVFVVDNLSTGKRENVPSHITLIEGDIRIMDKLEGLPKQVDAIFHLAAQIDVRNSVADPSYDASVNIQGTISVLNYAVEAGAQRIIFSSSGGAIYGATGKIPTKETAPISSSSPYGIAKYCAERYIELFSRLHNIHYVILRYSNVYGPGQSGSRECGVIAIFAEKVLNGEPLTIWGDGEQTRDYVYVGDVVRANLAALGTQVQDVFNISTAKETSVNDLAEIYQNTLSQKLTIIHTPAKKGEERRSCLDATKAQEYLGWKAQVSLQDGVETTYETMLEARQKQLIQQSLKTEKVVSMN